MNALLKESCLVEAVREAGGVPAENCLPWVNDGQYTRSVPAAEILQFCRLAISELVRVLPNPDDAARDDRLNLERPGPREQRVALGARIEPDLGDALPRDLVDDALADIRGHVERCHVDGSGYIEHRPIGLQSLDLAFVQIDGNHRV